MTDFYYSLKKTRIKNKDDDGEYKNTTLLCIRAALNRYFKQERGLDIISNELFITTNGNFQAVIKKGKVDGRGEIDYHEAISEGDLQKLADYLKKNMKSPPNAQNLMEMVLFNIIYYTPATVEEKT